MNQPIAQLSESVLRKRGLLEAAQAMNWKAVQWRGRIPYWRYPLVTPAGEVIGHRYKAITEEGLKYHWGEGKPSDLWSNWYFAHDVKEAVAAADGVAYLANGEPSLLAFRAAGVQNVIATTHSEVTVPPAVAESLTALGITKLINIADSDAAGEAAAVKWRNALHETAIDYAAHKWDAALGSHADANDLWLHVEQDAARFRAMLLSVEPLLLPSYEASTQPVRERDRAFDTSEPQQRMANAVERELEARHVFTGKQHGAWRTMNCIHHDDQNASAGFNVESGTINCFACGSHSLSKNAQYFNIDWRDYYPQYSRGAPERPAAITEPEPPAVQQLILQRHEAFLRGERYAWINQAQLPVWIVSAILNLAHGRSSAPAVFAQLHHAFYTGTLNWAIFSAEEVYKVLNLRRGTVQRALDFLEELGFIEHIDDGYVAEWRGEGAPEDGGGVSHLYTVAPREEHFEAQLLMRLRKYYAEKYHRKSAQIPSPELGEDIGLTSHAQYSLWKQRMSAASAMSAEDRRLYEIEFGGSQRGGDSAWRGWSTMMREGATIALDMDSVRTSLDLRIALLRHWITIEDVNSRIELQRLLGCSDSGVTNVLDAADVVSVPQNQTETIELTHNTDLRGFVRDYQTNHRAMLTVVRYEYKRDAGWMRGDVATWREDIEAQRNRIARVFFVFALRSKQRPMTEIEIAERDEAVGATPMTKAIEEKTEAKQEAKAREPRRAKQRLKRRKMNRDWRSHSYEHRWQQAAYYVHCFTFHRLQGLRIVNKAGARVYTGRDIADVIRWVNAEGYERPCRDVDTYDLSALKFA